MLTLQNEPPTLDRDGLEHKYSRSFKDMIDSCLQKDPSRRPSAEKLLQHGFFKMGIGKKHKLAELVASLPQLVERTQLSRKSRIRSWETHYFSLNRCSQLSRFLSRQYLMGLFQPKVCGPGACDVRTGGSEDGMASDKGGICSRHCRYCPGNSKWR